MASRAPHTPFDVRTRVNFGCLAEPGRVMGYQAFRVLLFIHDFRRENGREPSYTEICVALQIGTKGEVSRIIGSLEMRGFVHRPECTGPTDRRVRLIANL